MANGLTITFDLLTSTDNEAAVRVLIPALDNPDPAVQERALVALLKRRTAAGGKEILDRLARMKPEWKTILRQHRSRLTGALRDAVLSTDPGLCENGCRAAVMFRDYDLIPTLLSALDSSACPRRELAAATVLELVQALFEELAGKRDAADRRDPQMVRRYVLGSLESSVHRYGQHKYREVLEAFLLLVGRENATLRQVLAATHHAALASMIDVLTKSAHRGVITLLLALLEDTHVPNAVLGVIAGRGDIRFVHHLMRKIGREPPPAVAYNLKRINTIAWLGDCRRLMEQLDDAGQQVALRFVMASGVPRLQAFSLIETLLLEGKPEGRREAARLLAEFHGADANSLAMRALGDPDPRVQANIVPQLRGRGIPGVLPNLLALVESPYTVVRKAAREALSEFSFRRFVAAFDMLDEEVRESTGLLVKKIDTEAVPLLAEELKSPIRTRRIRALKIARAIDAVAGVEDAIIELLQDEDHLVRLEAVSTLVGLATPSARAAIYQAQSDKSEVVRQAAARGLADFAQVATTEVPLVALNLSP